MFTGIITDIGKIINISNTEHRLIKIGCSYDENDIDIGASIACSGVCLTVINKGNEQNQNYFEVEVSQETDDKTTTKFWKEGTKINLEKSLKVGDEIGGHLPEALINYLLRLGWSHGDQEIFSLEEMIKYFSIEKIRKSPSKFDIDKLNDINSIYLKIAQLSWDIEV